MTQLTTQVCLTKPACQGLLLALDCQETQIPLAGLVALEALASPEHLLDPLDLLGLVGLELLLVGLPPEWV